jgi:hypothetical protein
LKKIIIYSEISWNFLDQRHHHLARYAANAGWSVEFVSRVVSRFPSFEDLIYRTLGSRNKMPGHLSSGKDIPPNVMLRRSFFLPSTTVLSSSFNFVVWFLWERKKQKSAVVYSFIDNPNLIGNGSKFKLYETSVFDIIHNWWAFPWDTKSHKVLVSKCLTCYEKIVTDSPSVAAKLLEIQREHLLMLPGVTPDWLRCGSDSLDSKPLFFGNLRKNSDLDLVKKIDQCVGLDIIGIIDPSIVNEIGQPSFLGKFDGSAMFSVIKNYNILLLPYNNSEFSSTIAPAKYFEALATGSLVVTCADMSHLPGFDDFVFKVNCDAQNLKEQLVERLISQRRFRDLQISFAEKNLWEQRFQLLFGTLRSKQ